MNIEWVIVMVWKKIKDVDGKIVWENGKAVVDLSYVMLPTKSGNMAWQLRHSVDGVVYFSEYLYGKNKEKAVAYAKDYLKVRPMGYSEDD
jgi:hypothetical protein